MDGRRSKSVAVWSPHHSLEIKRLHSKSYQPPTTRSKASGKKRHASKQNNDETNNNDNTAAAAAASTNTNWGGSGSTNSQLLSSKTTIENYNNTHSSNTSAVLHTSNNNTKIDNGISSPSTPKRTKLNNTSTSAGDENNNLSNTPEKGELHQQPKNGIVASYSQHQQANKISPRRTRSSTALENSSTVSNETIIHDTERAKAANVVSFFAKLTSLQEESTTTDNSSDEGGVSGNGADGNKDYDFKRILPIDVIRSTECYNNEECYQQAAVEFVNTKDRNDKYNTCIKCLINDYGAGLDEKECKGITLSMAHRQEIVTNCNDGDDMDFPSTILLPSKVDEVATARKRWSREKRLKFVKKLAKSKKIKRTSQAPPVSLPQQSIEDIATDAELAAQGRPPRKLDPKSKGQGAAAIQNNYQLRNPNDEQPNNNFALINATNSDKYPNVQSDSFSLMPQDVYKRGIPSVDPDYYKNNVCLQCNICLQLIKGFKNSQDVDLNLLNNHAGPCAELKRTGKIDDQGQCACNATKDHHEFKGKGVHAFTKHAGSCHGTHCPKCGKDFDNWTSRLCKKPKVLSFVERQKHVNDKKIKSHKEWEEKQKKRG